MKTRIYSLLVALMSVVAFTACDDWTPGDQNTYSENTGGVSCSNMKVTVNESEASISRTDIDTSGYLVTITDKTTGNLASYDGKSCSWTYSQMPSIFTLPVGQYIVTVRSHEPEKAAWSTPYYLGTSEFEVKNNQVTYIGTVTCNFAAVKVGLQYPKDFLEKMDSWTVVVNAGVKGTSLTWDSKEKRYGYFIVEEKNPTITATISGKTKKGLEISDTKTVTDAKAGNFYIFTFTVLSGSSVIPDEYGNIVQDPDPETTGISIVYDVIETSIETSVAPGFDPVENPNEPHPDTEEWPENPNTPVDPIGPDNPTPDYPKDKTINITPEGFDATQVTPAVEGTYILHITSQVPLTNIEVEIISPYLTTEFLNSVGLTSKFDLTYPENTLKDPNNPQSEKMDLTERLSDPNGFNFPTGGKIIGQKSVDFTLTPFIPLLSLDDNPGEIHTFRLIVKDEAGNIETQDLKFQN